MIPTEVGKTAYLKYLERSSHTPATIEPAIPVIMMVSPMLPTFTSSPCNEQTQRKKPTWGHKALSGSDSVLCASGSQCYRKPLKRAYHHRTGSVLFLVTPVIIPGLLVGLTAPRAKN